MSINAVSNVSFGATTKNGNEYKKSHAATITGATLGTGAAVFTGYYINKELKANSPVVEKLVKGKEKQIIDLMKKGMSETQALKTSNLAHKIAYSIVYSGIALIGLGIGAGINKIVNHNKANKADAAAAKAE